MKPDQPPRSPIDRDVADAFAALDRAVEAGAADDLADRVLARLADEQPGRPTGSPGQGAGAAGAEDSGLHDIRELASSARKRFRERDGSEADGDDSAVLLTTAQGGLRGVALPDRRVAERVGPNGVRAGTEARRDARSSAPFWVLGSVATLAAAAAVAVFVFGIGREETDGLGEPTAAEPGTIVARAEQAPPAEAAASSPEAPRSQAAPPPPPSPAAAETATPAADSAAAPEPPRGSTRRLAKKPGPARAREGTAGPDRSKGGVAKEAEEDGEAGVIGGVVGGVEGGVVGGVEAGPGGVEAGPGAATGQGGGTVSLDELLDQATGKAPKPSPESEAERRRRAEPTKRGLERADVTDGLAAVADAVQRCAAGGTRGTVTVKFVVGPDGAVRSSSATGEHARSKAGACVASAVTRARFPRFEGDPVTIHYPFSLRGP